MLVLISKHLFRMHFLLILFEVSIALFVGVVKSQETPCAESQKHFADLCFAPKPLPVSAIDLKWLIENQPADGLHIILGNDIARLHFAEALQGKLLSPTDNFDDFCFRARVLHGDNPKEVPDGKFLGFKNLTSNWNCRFSVDFPGLLLCDDVYAAGGGVTKYHEIYNYYLSYTDHKNFQIAILCFPNGQVGWKAYSISETFTEAEQKFITDYVTQLGFSANNTVTMYNKETCSDQTNVVL